ncbi:MAG: hypothetical protein Q8O89_07225 [Nanoarchaeota archaeon]|nr:hypothetical protein [Nanoarchaeota archaeon]
MNMAEGNIESLIKEINIIGKTRLRKPNSYGVVVDYEIIGNYSRQSIVFGVSTLEEPKYLEFCAFSVNIYLNRSKEEVGILGKNGYVLPPTANMTPVGGDVFFPRHNEREYCILESNKQIMSAKTCGSHPYFKINDYRDFRRVTKESWHIQKYFAKELTKCSNGKALVKYELDLGFLWTNYLRQQMLKINDQVQFEKIESAAELPKKYQDYELTNLLIEGYKTPT